MGEMSFGRKIVLVAILLFAGAVIVLINRNPYSPRFQRVTSYTPSAYTELSYEFLTERPFEGGQAWLTLIDRTNGSAAVLFDLEQRKVVGQLLNAWPAYSSADRSKLLCITRGSPSPPWVERVKAAAAGLLRAFKISTPKFLTPTSSQLHSENYWILELKSNRATLISQISQFQGGGSSFHPSPDFRFGYNKPTTAGFTNLFWLCDLKEGCIRDAHADGWPAGWWDDHLIVVLTANNDFSLFDVVTGTNSPLLSATDIAAFLDEHHISHEDQRPSPFQTWNGRDFEFYVTDTHKKWSAEESFLLKVARSDAQLNVVNPAFQFEWSDHFHPSQQYYVYTGREAGDRSDAVYLRNLRTGAETTLVEPLGEKRFSIPHFYKDSVIYLRSNALWRVNLDGSNNERLFP